MLAKSKGVRDAVSYHDANLPVGDRKVVTDAMADGETHARIGQLVSAARALRADAEAIQAALSLAERRFQATFVHAPVGIAHVGLDGRLLMVNPRFADITGYPPEELMRTGFQNITHPEDLEADLSLLERLNAGELQRYTMEKRYLRPDGSFVWANLTVALVRDEAGEPDFYVSVIEDMSDMRQAYFDAIHDPLTGLLNRRGFAGHAQRMIQRAAHDGQWLSIVYLDLDGFKGLNDRLGHSAGDRCLTDLARRMEVMVSPNDAIARMGGDEFVLLIADLSAMQAGQLVERLRKELAEFGAGYADISGSFGLLTLIPDAATELSDIVRRADEAMLAAKRAGKNQAIVAPAG